MSLTTCSVSLLILLKPFPFYTITVYVGLQGLITYTQENVKRKTALTFLRMVLPLTSRHKLRSPC